MNLPEKTRGNQTITRAPGYFRATVLPRPWWREPWPTLLRLTLVLAMLLIPAIPGNASRVEQRDASMECVVSARTAARNTGIPESVLLAISLIETGRRRGGALKSWPWTVNLGGKGYWFRTRGDAQKFVRTMAARGARSMDIGCFQINTKWHGRAFPSIDAMFDPEIAATYAARLLRALYREKGSWPAAAGAYHSRSPARAERYAARFRRAQAALKAGDPRKPASPLRLSSRARQPERGPNTYPLLRALVDTRAAPGSLVFISDRPGKGLF